MSIVFFCQSCGARFEVDPRMAGKRGHCKKCGQIMTIPRAEEIASMSASPALVMAGVGAGAVPSPRAGAGGASIGALLRAGTSEAGVAPIALDRMPIGHRRPSRPSPLDDAEDSKHFVLAQPVRERGGRAGRQDNVVLNLRRRQLGGVQRVFRKIHVVAYLLSVPFLMILILGTAIRNRPMALLGATVVVVVTIGRLVALMKRQSTEGRFAMRYSRLRLAHRWLLSALVLLATMGSASANYFELLRRVPDSANTIILIDAERMLMSPIAMREKWRDKANSPEAGTLHFPINSERYMLAAKLNFVSNAEDVWDVALIETTSDVSLPYLSKREGGYLDTVEGKQVAFSPRDAFIVSFEPTILGVYFPANRQDLGRWLRTLQRHNDPQVSEYLRNAVNLAHGSHMVVAFDLGDLFTSRMIRDRLHRAESLAGKDINLDALTKVLTSVKGVTLSMDATERLNGKIRLDFGESPAPMKSVAKALIFEVLEDQGMMLNEFKEWRLLVEAKAITLEGRMTTKGLRTLTNLIPIPSQTLDLSKAEPKAGGTAPGTASPPSTEDMATTSRKYFQHISLLLEEVHSELKGPVMSPKLAQRLVSKAAQEIDRLSVLNVDEELIAYGAGVSSTFRNMRNLSKNAGYDASYRQASFAGNQGYGFYGGQSLSLSTGVMNKQMTAVLKSDELAVVTMLEEKTAEIRRKMTLKYKVEF